MEDQGNCSFQLRSLGSKSFHLNGTDNNKNSCLHPTITPTGGSDFMFTREVHHADDAAKLFSIRPIGTSDAGARPRSLRRAV